MGPVKSHCPVKYIASIPMNLIHERQPFMEGSYKFCQNLHLMNEEPVAMTEQRPWMNIERKERLRMETSRIAAWLSWWSNLQPSPHVMASNMRSATLDGQTPWNKAVEAFHCQFLQPRWESLVDIQTTKTRILPPQIGVYTNTVI